MSMSSDSLRGRFSGGVSSVDGVLALRLPMSSTVPLLWRSFSTALGVMVGDGLTGLGFGGGKGSGEHSCGSSSEKPRLQLRVMASPFQCDSTSM
jgi:hypothetical protein